MTFEKNSLSILSDKKEYHIEKRKDERYFMFIEILTLRMCVIKFFGL